MSLNLGDDLLAELEAPVFLVLGVVRDRGEQPALACSRVSAATTGRAVAAGNWPGGPAHGTRRRPVLWGEPATAPPVGPPVACVEPLPWPNSTLLRGDISDAVGALKAQSGGTLAIMGSSVLIASLMAADLIDEYLLMIHPLVLGTGRRLFPAGVQLSLRLTSSVTSDSGMVIATYEPAHADVEGVLDELAERG